MKEFKFFKKKKITEYDREFYNIAGFELIGVTPTTYNPSSFEPCRFLLLRDTQTGERVRGNLINYNHPMWDYNERF